MTVSVTPGGKYYVTIMAQVVVGDLEKTNLSVGIDLGLKDFVITSDNDRYSSNKFIKKYSKKLATMQKHLSRKKFMEQAAYQGRQVAGENHVLPQGQAA